MKKFICLVLLLIMPFTVKASEIDSADVTLTEEITNNDMVNGSRILLGTDLDIMGITNGISLVLGNNIDFKGNSDYQAIFGNDITISGNFMDGAIFGNNIKITSDAIINRDVAIFGNTVIISGTIKRDIVIFASKVILDHAVVNRDVRINASNIEIDEDSTILGLLSYNEDANIKNNNNVEVETFVVEKPKVNIFNNVLSSFTTIVGLLVLFLVSLLLVPKFYEKITIYPLLKTLGLGLIALIVVPITSIILILTTFGMPLGAVMLILYLLVVIFSKIISGYVVGSLIVTKLIKKKLSPYLQGLVGIILVYLFAKIPYLGTLVAFLSVILALGIFISLFKKNRQ